MAVEQNSPEGQSPNIRYLYFMLWKYVPYMLNFIKVVDSLTNQQTVSFESDWKENEKNFSLVDMNVQDWLTELTWVVN